MTVLDDEKRCDLEDDESFEEQKGNTIGSQLKIQSRHFMTPTAVNNRKSSINATPTSRIIEPGKIFSSRHMTPASATGFRGRINGL